MRPSEPAPARAPPTNYDDQAFATSVLEASADCIKLIGPDGKLEYMNVNGLCLMEIDDFNAVRGQQYTALWPAHHRVMISDALDKAMRGEPARFEGDCPTAKGTLKFWDVIVSPVRGPDGKPRNLVAVSRDVTEQKRAEETAKLLAQELAHRMKNFFAVVDGLISMSARRAPDASAFAETLRARVHSLGRAISFITPNEMAKPATRHVHALLAELLSPYDESRDQAPRILVSGDDTSVGRSGATAVALMAHELATNAVKYGALAKAGGTVHVMTRRIAEGYEVVWEERCAKPLAGERGAAGFGARLMDNAVSIHLGGQLERTWAPEGLRIRMLLDPAALAR